ncbi:MAG: glycosyltransferase family 2 protein [Candidatus Hodarchaeota archaeon]
MLPRITIITPSFNQGQFIERTIESVLSQDIDGLEYIVIDGGSTDATVSILKRYGNKFDDRLRWISENDEGPAHAINKGILRTSAPVVGWLNSDDIYYSGALQAVLDFFDSHTEAEVVYGDANHIDENDKFIEKYPTEPWDWERLLETCFISQPATFVRREAIETYGLLDKRLRYSMDYEYWIRLAKQGVHFVYLPRLLAATRMHRDCFTLSSSEKCHRDINDFFRWHFGEVRDRWIFNYAHAAVRSKGFRDENRWRFALAVSAYSVYASLRWNHTISKEVLWKTIYWVAGNTWHAITR